MARRASPSPPACSTSSPSSSASALYAFWPKQPRPLRRGRAALRCARTEPMDQHHEARARSTPSPATSTTGHEWDGIRELNTPLPRWWLCIFYATIVWAIGYWIVYPAWPLLTDATKGVLGYASARSRSSTDMAHAQGPARRARPRGMADATLAQIKADPDAVPDRDGAGQGRLRRQLRRLPRHRRRRRQGLSQPERRRLALGRLARRDPAPRCCTASASPATTRRASARCRPSAATAC